LEIRRAEAVGILECLWHWTAKFAPRGDIGRFPDVEIEDGAYWEGQTGRLVTALVDTGWVDRSEDHRLVVHDWHEHTDDATKKALSRRGLEPVTAFRRTDPDWRVKNGSLPEPKPEPHGALTLGVPYKPYGEHVWSVYCERRGTQLPDASSADHYQMRKWYDAGIPPRVVAQALRECKGEGRTLRYYDGAVMDEAKRWARAMNL